MKSKFPAYHRIHKEDLISHFDDCIFIFDACALLDIYRMKKEVTEDVFKVIEHLKDQIRIPYHVAEEYFNNIHDVLNTQINNIKNSRSDFTKFIQNLEAKRSQPYISKKSNDLLIKLKKQVEEDFKQQEEFIKDQLIHGDYQNRMNELLNGNVLEPFSKEQLEVIEKEGEKRREAKIPPGYKDASKSSNRSGDLINWKEILRFAQESRKNIIIVSSEAKEDWVIREQGCTICLRYELLDEFYKTVGNNNQLLHFLSLDRFLELAREKDAEYVSEETVNEVKGYVAQPSVTNPIYLFENGKMIPNKMPYSFYLSSKEIEKQINILQEAFNSIKMKQYSDLSEIKNTTPLFNIEDTKNADKKEIPPKKSGDNESDEKNKDKDKNEGSE